MIEIEGVGLFGGESGEKEVGDAKGQTRGVLEIIGSQFQFQ